MKKVLSGILSSIVLLSTLTGFSFISFAETFENFEYSVENGNAIITEYTGAEEVVSIPETLGGYQVQSIDSYAFGNNNIIKEISLPNCVKTIKHHAFWHCNGISTLTIPNGVETIENSAFKECEGLINAKISNSVSSIGNEAFYGCKSLSEIELENGIEYLGDNAFRNCSNLSCIELPKSVKSIGDCAFSKCNSLTSIIVDSENTVYDSRDSCNAIIEKNTNTLIVGCKNTVIPNSVLKVGVNAFWQCENLDSIVVPQNIIEIENGAFGFCSQLNSITINNKTVKIGRSAFRYCDGLKDVFYISNKNDWNSIIIESLNEPLLNATIHCADGDIIPSEEHSHDYVLTKTVPATCVDEGYSVYTCTCGQSYRDNFIEATGKHISDSGTVTKKATPIATGTKVYKCIVCGQIIKTETLTKTAKHTNTLTVTANKPTVKFAKLKKKKQSIALKKWATVSNAKGAVSFKKLKGNKKIAVAKNGKITLKKGLKKGTYKIKIQVTAAGNTEYNASVKTVTVKIKVK